MPIDRKSWNYWMSKRSVPHWPCPRCRASLRIVKDSFKSEPDSRTKGLQSEPHADPEGFSGSFVCLLECSRSYCEVCAVSGRYYVESDETGWYEACQPLSITPPPQLIQIPDDCPKAVREETEAALILFWCDNAACLNRIRNALELLLDDLKVPRTTISDTKKRVRHPLHRRIELLEAKKPNLKEICARMMAVKHLGNAGSHSGEVVERKDVFDGFDILERVLLDMYSTHEGELARMVAQINKRKGPRKNGP
jgi:Domain of unknown function (DUF4145)